MVARRIRCHGDLHLDQVLLSGDSLTIVDFSGEPTWPLAARRIKRSPLRDVATMLRSFDRAARCAAQASGPTGGGRAEGTPPAKDGTRPGPAAGWTRFWYASVAAQFLRGYLETIERVPGLLPACRGDLALMLDALMLEKAVQEVQYELEHRPGLGRHRGTWPARPARRSTDPRHGVRALLTERRRAMAIGIPRHARRTAPAADDSGSRPLPNRTRAVRTRAARGAGRVRNMNLLQ